MALSTSQSTQIQLSEHLNPTKASFRYDAICLVKGQIMSFAKNFWVQYIPYLIRKGIYGQLRPSMPSYSISFLGPRHTRVKSRDHEIVGAQKKASKGRPNTPPKIM